MYSFSLWIISGKIVSLELQRLELHSEFRVTFEFSWNESMLKRFPININVIIITLSMVCKKETFWTSIRHEQRCIRNSAKQTFKIECFDFIYFSADKVIMTFWKGEEGGWLDKFGEKIFSSFNPKKRFTNKYCNLEFPTWNWSLISMLSEYTRNQNIYSTSQYLKKDHWVKSVRIRSFSGPYSVKMRVNANQKNSENRHFSRCRQWIVLCL